MFYDAIEDKLWDFETRVDGEHCSYPLASSWHDVLILLLRSLYVAFAVFCVLNIVAWCKMVKHQNEPQNMQVGLPERVGPQILTKGDLATYN